MRKIPLEAFWLWKKNLACENVVDAKLAEGIPGDDDPRHFGGSLLLEPRRLRVAARVADDVPHAQLAHRQPPPDGPLEQPLQELDRRNWMVLVEGVLLGIPQLRRVRGRVAHQQPR